ncbi:hypothetical protein [Sorangium sp. So ce176]|uniref:hypothetical protein n=1 Tax=Sorangium sp. So ce176 TaxID=3133286 RepID=UPI003F62CFEB
MAVTYKKVQQVYDLARDHVEISIGIIKNLMSKVHSLMSWDGPFTYANVSPTDTTRAVDSSFLVDAEGVVTCAIELTIKSGKKGSNEASSPNDLTLLLPVSLYTDPHSADRVMTIGRVQAKWDVNTLESDAVATVRSAFIKCLAQEMRRSIIRSQYFADTPRNQ